MIRPNRYPYTRSQWVEITTLIFFGKKHLEFKVERNRITRESRECR